MPCNRGKGEKMDYSTIIVAVLSLIGTLIGSFLANDKNSALIAYRLEELEKKVQKHNNIVERLAIVERDLTTANSRIDDEKREIKEIREGLNHE